MQFIPDEEIILNTKTDVLKTSVYVDTLRETITSVDTNKPFTVGLFGGWGSGKSSIVRTLEARLKESKNTRTVFYDAWKYSKDAFRRSFLLEVKEQLGLDPQSSFEEFYCDKVTDVGHKVRIQRLPLLFTVPIIAIGLLILSVSLFGPTTLSQKVIGVLSGVGISVFTILLQFVLQNLFITYKVAEISHKLFSPEQFDGVFKEAIEELTSQKRRTCKWIKEVLGTEDKVDRIVIIIDNIDRCHKQLSTELLLTVKNFLEIPKCIFVIPVDDEAIKKYLSAPGNEGEEFLRKFFNTVIRIKKHSYVDLFNLTNHLITKWNLRFSSNVTKIVSQEFAKNPRRVIQFLNNLSSELYVAEQQEASGSIVSGTITNNVDFLAKLLLIREEWPNIYDYINLHQYILDEINQHIRNGTFKFEEEEKLYKCDAVDLSLTREQYLFLFRTQTIHAINVEPFLRLRDFDQEIPDDLLKYIDDADWTNIGKLLKEERLDIDKLWDILYRKLDLAINQRDLIETDGFTLLSLVFEITAKKDYEKEFQKVYKTFEPFVNNAKIRAIIPNFNPQSLLAYSVKLSKAGKSYLCDLIATSLKDLIPEKSLPKALIKQYIKSYANNSKVLSKIRPVFSRLITTDFATLEDEDYKEILKGGDIATSLIEGDVVDKSIEGIENNYEDKEIVRRVKISKFLNTIGVVTGKQKSKYLQKIHPFANNNNWPQTHFWLDAMTNFIEKTESLGETGLWPTLQNRHNHFFQQFYGGRNRGDIQTQCVMTLMSLLKEYYVASTAIDAPPIQIILSYLNHNESKEVYLHANSLLQEIIDFYEVYDWPFSDSVMARFDSIPDFSDKKQIAQTLLKMLKKTKHNKDGWKGLKQEQVDNIIDKFLSILFSGDAENSKEAETWFVAILKMRAIKPILGDKIGSLSDITQLKQALTLVDRLQDKQLTSRVVDTILNSDLTYAGLDENVQKITQITDSSSYIRKSLLKLLGQTKISQLDTYKPVVETSVRYQGVFNDSELEILADKLARLLTLDFPHAIFACQELLKLKSIPPSKRAPLRHFLTLVKVPDDENKKKNEKILYNLRKKIA